MMGVPGEICCGGAERCSLQNHRDVGIRYTREAREATDVGLVLQWSRDKVELHYDDTSKKRRILGRSVPTLYVVPHT